MNDQQLTLDDVEVVEPIDETGLTEADRAWRQAGCPIPVPVGVIPF